MHRTSPQRQEAGQSHDGSLLGDALRVLTRATSRWPRLTLCLVLVAACVSAGYTALTIGFKTDRADLIDPKADFHQRWLQYTEDFGDAADVVVVVEADRTPPIEAALDDLGARLTREPECFTNVLYRVESGALRQKGLQYLSPRQLETGLQNLAAYRPVLRGAWDLVRLDALAQRLQAQLESRPAGASAETGPLYQHAQQLVASLSALLADPDQFRSPWPEILPVGRHLRGHADRPAYLLSDDGTMGFIKLVPAKSDGFEGYAHVIARLRELAKEVTAAHDGVTIGITGIPVLESDEMVRSQSDMLVASIISFVGVGLVLFIGFRGVRHPLLAMLMLAVGMAWSFGFTTLTVGHLNILSVSFAVILIGLGIDFAIHYLARYLQLRHEGKPLRPALKETSVSTGAGIITAAATTALAFFCATLTQFLGVAELGIIAGGGILLCALATFVVLPPLVALCDEHTEPRRLPTPFQGQWLRAFTARFPLPVLLVSMAVVVGIGSQALTYGHGNWGFRIAYDSNLLNLQADGLDSVEIQKRVFQKSNDSLLYAVSVADSPEEARALRAKFEMLPTVHHVEELASRLPGTASPETARLVQAYQTELAVLPQQVPQVGPLNPAMVGRSLERLYGTLRHRSEPQAAALVAALDKFLDRFETLSVREQSAFLNAYQTRSNAALLGQFHALAAATDPTPLRWRDLPPELTSRFVSPEGKWLLQIFPKSQIWAHEPLARFVQDVRSVDPEATGTPLQNYEASRQIRRSYETASLYALAVIGLVLLIDFLGPENRWLTLLPPLAVVGFATLLLHARRADYSPLALLGSYVGMATIIAAVLDARSLRNTLLGMLPPLAGGIIMFGLLGLFGIDLNPANLIVLPLILGIGVDDGVHVVHDFRQQQGTYRMSPSTMNAIVLTSLTTMIGFGSLMIAAHRGLYSVGLVLVIGVGSCLFVSLIPLPALLMLLSRDSDAAAQTAATPSARRDDAADPRTLQNQKRKAA